MFVFPFFRGDRIPGYGLNLGVDDVSVQRADLEFIALHDDHLTRFEKNHPASVLQDGGKI